MKRKIVFIMVIVAIFAAMPCNAKKKVDDKKVELTTDKEKASYAIGMQLGTFIQQE